MLSQLQEDILSRRGCFRAVCNCMMSKRSRLIRKDNQCVWFIDKRESNIGKAPKITTQESYDVIFAMLLWLYASWHYYYKHHHHPNTYTHSLTHSDVTNITSGLRTCQMTVENHHDFTSEGVILVQCDPELVRSQTLVIWDSHEHQLKNIRTCTPFCDLTFQTARHTHHRQWLTVNDR